MTLLGLIVVWGVGTSLGMVLVCTPVRSNWDTSRTALDCKNQNAMYQSLVITNVVTDFLIICLPMYTVWHLQIRKVEKLALTACFALGSA